LWLKDLCILLFLLMNRFFFTCMSHALESFLSLDIFFSCFLLVQSFRNSEFSPSDWIFAFELDLNGYWWINNLWLKDLCILLFLLMNRFFFMDEINWWLFIYDIIKWLVIYIKRDWRQLYNYFLLVYIYFLILYW
jgi:hypothetical protein